MDSRKTKNYDENMNRAKDWLKQAHNDLLWGMDTLKAGHFSQVCFVAQQVAEKSLKALALSLGYDSVRSHSLLTITRAMKINGEMEAMDFAKRFLEIIGEKIDSLTSE